MPKRTMFNRPLWLLCVAGCVDPNDLYREILTEQNTTAPDTTTTDATTVAGTTAVGEPTSSTAPPLQTVTGAADTTSGAVTTTAADLDLPADSDDPPLIKQFLAKPAGLYEPGAAELSVVVVPTVSAVRLTRDGDPTPLFEGPPEDFAHTHLALSDADDAELVFTLAARVGDGPWQTADTPLTVDLPPAGSVKCAFTDTGAISSILAAITHTSSAVFALGRRDIAGISQLTLWAFDPDDCDELLPGWPRTLADWTLDPVLADLPSDGVALTVDAHGELIVAGNLLTDPPRPYVARLTPDGDLVWEQLGSPDDHVAGVAAFSGLHHDRVLAVGHRRTHDEPPSTDALYTLLQFTNGQVFASSYTLKAPFTPDEPDPEDNLYNERIHAVVSADTFAFAVGEREFKVAQDEIRRRTFALRIDASADILGAAWTSPGVDELQDGARAVARCGDDFLAGGWTRHLDPGSKSSPLLLWLDTGPSYLAHRPDGVPSAETYGVDCDRLGRPVSAAVQFDKDLDAVVFAVPGPQGVRTLYADDEPGHDLALALACDEWGLCAAGGYRTVDGAAQAALITYYP